MTEISQSSEFLNPSQFKFSEHIPMHADQNTGLGPQPTLPVDLEAEIPQTQYKLPHFGQFDHEKRYETAAILTEHDIEARVKASKTMEEDVRFSHLVYGDANYFCAWEELVRQNIQDLVRTKGRPRYTFDGSTGLPIVSIYQQEEYNANKIEGRRHSLVYGEGVEPEYLTAQKSQLRRNSLTHETKKQTDRKAMMLAKAKEAKKTLVHAHNFTKPYVMEVEEDGNNAEGSE